MPIIISKGGENAERVEKSAVEYESMLQKYIHHNPEILPVDEISEGTKLLVLAREFHTTSGPLDAIGIDNEGHIYIIETKLLRNPDRRTVIAQALDYGAALWKGYEDPQDFIDSLNQKCGDEGLAKKIQTAFDVLEDETDGILETVKSNLSEGAIRFIILMDKLHDHLKDMIVFMNQNSKFDFYGVELEYYQHKPLGIEIMIPNMFGMGIKKEIGAASPPAQNPIRVMNKQVMKDAAEELNAEFEKEKSFFTKQFHVYQSRWGESGSVFVDIPYSERTVSIGAKLGKGKLSVGLYGWNGKDRDAVRRLYEGGLDKLVPGMTENTEDQNNPLRFEVPISQEDEQQLLDFVVKQVSAFTKSVLQVMR